MTRTRKRWIVRLLCVAPLLVLAIVIFPRPAPATIQEQRNRLPPPADCGDDPVVGIWKSHAYYPHHGQWYIFTLTIHRVPGSERELVGNVHSHYWLGTTGDQEPPPCRAGGYHQTVIMPANGTVDGMNIEFGGTSWEIEQTFCGSPTTGYYPDRFSGVIDPSIEEFQSVNNDGGPMVNYPTVFRRIRCLENPESPPPVVVAPPDFYPGKGCDCSVF
jgi:hypothetical protein